MQKSPKSYSGPIAWMAKNSVTANLLMIFLIVGGLIVASRVKQEVFPEFELDLIRVEVLYPGASPEEVEQGIILSVEDEVRGLDGVKNVNSVAQEGKGSVFIELLSGANTSKALQDVKNRVDSIQSIPIDAERPIVSLIEARRQVLSVIIYGDQNRKVLKNIAEKVREDLIQIEGITLVDLAGTPPLEISIEVPQHELRRYNLTLERIAQIVRDTALELPGGGVKTPGGEILLRTQERRDYAAEYEDIAVVTNPDGSKVRLGEIATIKDGFEDTDEEAFFNGKHAIRIEVFRVGSQTPIEISDKVNQYIKEIDPSLPDNVQIATWDDRSELYEDRVNLLIKNALLGLCLVLGLLGLFLEPRLAFWVTLGIPISIIGSFLFIPVTGVSINMVSLFAFIVTLGIVVDDAIVVGENIYQKREKGLPFLAASIEGAKEMAVPVFFAVSTNIAAFLPLFFVPGSLGKIFMQIPAITVTVFLISLVESLYILPSHLSHDHKKSKFWKWLTKPSLYFEKKLSWFIDNIYSPQLKISLANRYITFSIGLGVLLLSIGLVIGGVVQFSYLPRVESDIVTVQAQLPFGVSIQRAREIQERIVEGAQKVIAEEEGDPSRGVYTQIGTPLTTRGPDLGVPRGGIGSHIVGIQVQLLPSEQREISAIEFAKRWEDHVGELTGIESILFNAQIDMGTGSAIDIELSHPDKNLNELAAQRFADRLANYTGVSQIDSGISEGKQQFSFTLTPVARGLGLTVRDLARQVRSSFYGAEALRQQRGRNEVKVMVRLPEVERSTSFTVEELILRTPTGIEIPLTEAANFEEGRSYTEIRRRDGRRVIAVTADVDEEEANANEIIADIRENLIPEFKEKYPGLKFGFEGQQRDQLESLEALGIGFVFAMIAIFTLLAIPFKSYAQPLIVMISIPFGIIGAVIGHLLLGYELSIISMFGIIALAGVVVNDSLVLVVTANKFRKEKQEIGEALFNASLNRFRPIVLTSLTTFFGLAPMIFERSVQARFLVPMAISLGFGILFTTFIILLLTPCLYLIIEDIKHLTLNKDELIEEE